MIVNIVSVILIAALIALFVWLATRAWRARSGAVRWIGTILSGLLALVLLAVLVVALIGFYRLSVPPYTYAVPNLQAATAPEQIALGERRAQICVGCHSTTGNLPLDGGPNFLEGGPPAGTIAATNLTPGGPLRDWTDGEIICAIREGVSRNGRPLLIMPSMAFHAMSDADAQALAGYLRAQPAVDNPVPPTEVNIVGALLVGAGLFPTAAQTPITGPVIAPPPGAAEHGKYLVDIGGCRDCHGPDLAGSAGGFGLGPAPSLKAVLPNWTYEQFAPVLKTGTLPSGRQISPEAMPWPDYSRAFTDEELRDIYQYLHGLTP